MIAGLSQCQPPCPADLNFWLGSPAQLANEPRFRLGHFPQTSPLPNGAQNAFYENDSNPEKLADFRDPRLQASRAEIVASLRGNWRTELLFQVKQELARYDFCQAQIEECDRELQQQLRNFPDWPREEQGEKRQISNCHPRSGSSEKAVTIRRLI